MSYTPPPPPPPGAGGYATPQTNKKALWSMILGILALVCCGLVTGIPALVLRQQRQEGDRDVRRAPSPAPGWRRPG